MEEKLKKEGRGNERKKKVGEQGRFRG